MHDISALPLAAAGRSERSPGPVWAYRMIPGEPARPLADAEIEAALASAEGWVWLHVDLIDLRSHAWVGRTCGLPEAARAILAAHTEGLALRHEAGVVHGICADFHRELDHKVAGIGRLVFAVTERFLVTGRRHTLCAPDDVRQALHAGARPETAFDLLGTIIGAFCQQVGLRLAEATTQLDEVEDHLVNSRVSNERRRLMAVRRLALSLHRPIAALAAQFQQEDRLAWDLPRSGHAVLQRVGDRIATLDRDVVTINDRARLLQEEVAAELEEESNRSLKALAVMSALLLPPSLVTGIFGMNTGDLPFAETPGGFWIALGLAGLATTLFYLALLRSGVSLRL